MAQQTFRVDTAITFERAILVGIDFRDGSWPLDESLDELERLTNTAGAIVVGRLTQRLSKPNARTFIGQGKAQQLAQDVVTLEADIVIFDDELTPSQQANLEKLLGEQTKVIDRTALILDIFALHATSREGRLQVRLAQNQYLYPRLRGMWSHLASNRMGGGVGSRFGEGESQLEVDRRLVRKRIGRIRSELEDVARSRQTQRKKRVASGVFRVALAGYTNAGKSSLLNALCDESVLACDKLFATLDSTTRQLETPTGMSITLTDTVGFIQKLPHTLVEAFHSTLEEVAEADLVLLVVDSSNVQRDAQLAAVRDVLGHIGAENVPAITVYNKCDLLDASQRERLATRQPDALLVSAHTCEGLDELLDGIENRACANQDELHVLVPYAQGQLVELAHEKCLVQEESYCEQGVALRLRVPRALRSQFSAYECDAAPQRGA